MTTFEVLKQIRRDLRELSNDTSATGEALAAILHELDRMSRCLRIVLKLTRHLHSSEARRKRRRRE